MSVQPVQIAEPEHIKRTGSLTQDVIVPISPDNPRSASLKSKPLHNHVTAEKIISPDVNSI
jgi:hypothetical protein